MPVINLENTGIPFTKTITIGSKFFFNVNWTPQEDARKENVKNQGNLIKQISKFLGPKQWILGDEVWSSEVKLMRKRNPTTTARTFPSHWCRGV